jgi:all-trans-retinol dehydrogenase (NAD+)
VAEVHAKLGPVSILVNNAGIVQGRSFLSATDEEMEMTMKVNTLAHFWTVKAVLPGMLARNSGHIVAVSSATALAALPGLADYSASKAATAAFMDAIRLEIKRLQKNVKTTIVFPYFIRTGMFAGAEFRFPRLFPPLTPESASDSIVDAVLAEEAVWMMPVTVNLAYFIRALLPIEVCDDVAYILGLFSAMDKFVGRSGPDARGALETDPGVRGVRVARAVSGFQKSL